MSLISTTDFDSAYFERMAALEDSHPWTRSMRILTFQLLRRYGAVSGNSILDAGCGTGLFLREWAATFPGGQEAGIDLSLPSLPIAQTPTSALLLGASADDLPFRNNSFDVVHSADVLQHMTQVGSRQALIEFHRVLRPGGLVALRLRATRRLIPNTADIDFNHAYSIGRIKAEMEAAGFRPLFLKRFNLLPSLAAELVQRLRPPSAEEQAAPVKGISLRTEKDWRGQLLATYLACERIWLKAGGPGLPVGHTIIAVGPRL